MGGRRVHNLTIADFHTYHVAAGDQDVLVHDIGKPGESTAELAFMDGPWEAGLRLRAARRLRAAQ
ncbi:hypothetical protein [Nonomuraea jabiensis]|uniref:hypothetical protein n=1 Tax=Nonomuraea jabiensis TaxID=882448 RepID=UPI0036B7492C